MATPSTSTTDSERIPLSRERIVEAAVFLADQHGVAALSMRKLAAELGYEAMSLYNHVANKDDLLDAMLDAVYGELPAPVRAGGWKAATRRRAIEIHGVLLRHSWAPPLLPHLFPGPHRWQESEYLLGLLADAEFDDHVGDLAYHAITLHIAGFTQQQISYSVPAEVSSRQIARMREAAPRDTYPLMNLHVDYHLERDAHRHSPLDEFEFVLDLILDGLDRMRTPEPANRDD